MGTRCRNLILMSMMSMMLLMLFPDFPDAVAVAAVINATVTAICTHTKCNTTSNNEQWNHCHDDAPAPPSHDDDDDNDAANDLALNCQ